MDNPLDLLLLVRQSRLDSATRAVSAARSEVVVAEQEVDRVALEIEAARHTADAERAGLSTVLGERYTGKLLLGRRDRAAAAARQVDELERKRKQAVDRLTWCKRELDAAIGRQTVAMIAREKISEALKDHRAAALLAAERKLDAEDIPARVGLAKRLAP